MIIPTERLRLISADASQGAAYASFYRRNRAHLQPWEPPLSEVAFDPAIHADGLRREADTFGLRSARFGMFAPDGATELLGFCNLYTIVRGAWWSATLGYALDAAATGKGLMTEAAAAVIGYAFRDLRLHRLQANYRPENVRSGKVLERLGFTVDGHARDYLFIDGAWRDHVLTSLLNPGRPTLTTDDIYLTR